MKQVQLSDRQSSFIFYKQTTARNEVHLQNH